MKLANQTGEPSLDSIGAMVAEVPLKLDMYEIVHIDRRRI
jgi:hypothetical protein